MKICAIQKTTLIDYPGHVAATLFTAGCNFRCPWCYSKELVLPELLASQVLIPQEKILEFLKEKQGLLEGVVLCGGEPTLHSNLTEFIKKIKSLSFKVKLDTNGSNPAMINELIDKKLVDYVAMDIKLPKERYDMVFGDKLSVEAIEQSIFILKNSGIEYEFRTTVAPMVHSVDDLVRMAKWIGVDVPGPKPRYFLQKFRAERTIDPAFENLKAQSEDYFKEAQARVAPYVAEIKLRGS